jgi:hypothetical protein
MSDGRDRLRGFGEDDDDAGDSQAKDSDMVSEWYSGEKKRTRE